MEALWGSMNKARHLLSLQQQQRAITSALFRSTAATSSSSSCSSQWQMGKHQQQQQQQVILASQSQPAAWSFSVREFSTNVWESIPPNLKIDKNSSFAPITRADLLGEQAFHDDEEEDQQEGDEQSETTQEGEESLLDDEDGYEDDEDYYDQDEELFLPPSEIQYAIPLPERLHVPIYKFGLDPDNNEAGTIWLNEIVYGRDPIRIDLMKRAVVYYRNKKRGKRKAKTKTISEVSGSGKKLRAQKGQGRARVGHSRPPHFRGGAKAHGPKNETDYGNTKLNRKVRKKAVISALSQKLKEGNLILINQLYDITTFKTRETAQKLKVLGGIGGKTGKSALILDSYWPEKDDKSAVESYKGVPSSFRVSAKNIPKIMVGCDHDASVYEILRHEKLVMTVACMQTLEERLKDY